MCQCHAAKDMFSSQRHFPIKGPGRVELPESLDSDAAKALQQRGVASDSVQSILVKPACYMPVPCS